jgi:ubiquinone/menaquinone biosynthesis C-methylase UbiE
MAAPSPSFARDADTASYYDQRAAEYDEWYEDRGQFAAQGRDGWRDEVIRLIEVIRALSPARTLDVACGTGFITQHLRGIVVGLDQSPAMVAMAQPRLPQGVAMVGDALDLPFADRAFDRVVTGHFYGHLPPDERAVFLAQARRVAPELIVFDSAARAGQDTEEWQERVLNDGSRHLVYKRYLRAEELAEEIGGEVLLSGRWFVAARRTP